MASENIILKEITSENADSLHCISELWKEIQFRYKFEAPNQMNMKDYLPPNGRFWIAYHFNNPIGSIAYTKISEDVVELDAVFVSLEFRKKGIASLLLNTLIDASKANQVKSIKLRAGLPQPEALAFYKKFEFIEIPKFGKWKSDPTAVCMEKIII